MLGDDVLLAHSIDEAIVLARDLSTQLQYSSAARPSVLGPLTAHPVFSRWLNMERKAALRDHAGRAANKTPGQLVLPTAKLPYIEPSQRESDCPVVRI